jgi:FMN phosphatase YigB (HAD superfamily)
MQPKAVCFDLGGVFLQINHEWANAAEAAGCVITNRDPGGINDFAGLDDFQAERIHFDEYCDGLAAYLGLESRSDAAKVHAGILESEYPGIGDLCRDLKAAGIHLACLSNTNGPHWEAMNTSSLYPDFQLLDTPMASHELRVTKPSLEIFAIAESRIGLDGSEIILYDDMAENALAAREAGWQAFNVDPMADTPAQMREHLQSLGVNI